MSGKTHFWVGSVMLALAMGILVSSAIVPRTASAQDAESSGGRYALVRGVPGSTANSETLYVLDDLNQIVFFFEYSSRSRTLEPKAYIDLQPSVAAGLKKRALRQK
ncbi:hypothetical protein HQ560_04720 [bacterium]|nr:hypothetical protein [bacterium]